MKKVKVIVLRTAGTNCDYETVYAFQLAGAVSDLVHINQLINRKKRLADYHILALPGGFSYGDDIAAGKLLANELKYKIKEQLEEFGAAGKLIIGICNGFQVLVKAGLLPGFNGISDMQETTLYLNDSAKFECRWIYLQTQDSPSVFTKNLKSRIYLPVAHAEGKFTAEEKVLDTLEENRQVVFRYVAPQPPTPFGKGDSELVGYPWNPNGSDRNIAGICDTTGRILGMMPHPERYLNRLNHPRWTREQLPEEGDGLAIFRNGVGYVQEHLI
ncbi:phosphoribosylformylglycinamidine synthase I [Candidatus Poribacteria bacterium]|nr:phosphoribosylformylglycinamidine synthase I [Candidatus Poribacteria bacterium]